MDKEIIKEALEYYNIKNIDYQEKCTSKNASLF